MISVRRKLKTQGINLPSITPLLGFVAIGTLCDMVPLTPINRALVRLGIKQMGMNAFPGISVFLEHGEKNGTLPINEDRITFGIGPHINSKGRLGDPAMALKLFKTLSRPEANSIFFVLNQNNEKRKRIQAQVFEEAKTQVREYFKEDNPSILVVYKHDWHEGVVGIVASQLIETFRRPAIVLTNSETQGVIKGSARSTGEVNIYEQLSLCNDMFINFGEDIKPPLDLA